MYENTLIDELVTRKDYIQLLMLQMKMNIFIYLLHNIYFNTLIYTILTIDIFRHGFSAPPPPPPPKAFGTPANYIYFDLIDSYLIILTTKFVKLPILWSQISPRGGMRVFPQCTASHYYSQLRFSTNVWRKVVEIHCDFGSVYLVFSKVCFYICII